MNVSDSTRGLRGHDCAQGASMACKSRRSECDLPQEVRNIANDLPQQVRKIANDRRQKARKILPTRAAIHR